MTRAVEIVVHVTRSGDRAIVLLEDLAVRLRHNRFVPDERRGYVRVTFYDMTKAEAWDRVRAALDDLGGDWRNYLHLNPLDPSDAGTS